MSVAVVIPMFNEAATIADLERRMPPEVAEPIVVDDGSTDDGPARAAAAGARVLSLGRRRGIGAAIRAGLFAARAAGHSVVVVMTASGKDDPAEIPRLLAPLDEGYDYVQGSRYLPGGSRPNLPLVRGALIKAFTLVFGVLTGFRCTDAANGFRAYRLALLDDPRIKLAQDWLDSYELEYYLFWKVLERGYRVREVAVSKTYPLSRTYSKVRPFIDWWHVARALLLLALRLRD